MKNYIFVLLAVLLSATLWGDWVEVSGFEGNSLVEYEQSERSAINLEFNLDGYEREEILKSGTGFSRIIYKGEGSLLEVGMPDVPVFTRLIAIADEGDVTLNIISSDYEVIDNIIVYPQEELLTDSEPRRDTFTINEEYYSKGGIYPKETAMAGEPVIMRDLRLVAVSFCPFRYDASSNKLFIYHNISVELITTGQGGINSRNVTRKPSRAFTGIYESTVLNYAEVAGTRDEYQRPAILFIAPDNNNVATNLAYLTDWKEKKGFEVTSVNTDVTGTTSTAIKNYIQEAYDDWENPPEYVVLVGDANGSIMIPAWYETWSNDGGVGDQPYSQLEGSDILADVIIGRLSVNNVTQLQTMIAKAINYEREPYLTNEDWFEKATLVSDGGDSKQAVCKAVKTHIQSYNEAFSFGEHYNGNVSYGLDQEINNGTGYICARCGGGMSGWGEYNINSLTNGWMLPFMTMVTCYTGDFSATCLSESFTRAGTPSNPKGGLAAIGSATGLTSTCINNCITAGIFYGLFVEQVFTPGGALVRGKLSLYQQYPQNPNNQVSVASHWNNLMGDPSIDLWTSVPEAMIVFYDEEVSQGTNYMQVYVIESDGTPLEGAWVTARGSDYYHTGYTDNNGVYYLDLEGVILSDTYELTVTNHDKIPFEEEFTIVEAEVNLDIDQLLLDDTNNDGIPNPGEEINLELTVGNYGSSSAAGISAELESHNDYVIVTTASADLDDIAGGGTTTNSELAISIDAAAPGGIRAQLELILTADREVWTIPIFLDIAGALLNVTSYHVANINGIIDPGETVDIYITTENIGELAAMNVSGELLSENHRLTVIDSLGEFGSIMPGEEASNNINRFTISASSAILPGTQMPVSIHFTNPDGYDNIVSFLLEIGTVTQSDPLGPDAYGYYCYDDGDGSYLDCPSYNWVEIFGVGDNLGIYSSGSSATLGDVDLPEEFTFVFYGETYDLITASTSGWISPGGTDVASFMNWTIPGAHGPSPIIAAFWDDLYSGSGQVLTYFDANQHYFIIEWHNMHNLYNNVIETFQIILYDPNFYPTTSGDSNIKIQYQEFNNVNTGQYSYHSAQHGQYCTIGLEDQSGTIGLQYTFNNAYPTAAKPLGDETAIFFTVQPIPQDTPYLAVADYSAFSGDDGFIESGEDASINIVLENIGGETANAVEISITESDQYIEIIEASATCEQISADEMIELDDAFRISVSENVPDFYTFTLNVSLESQEGSWNQIIIFTAYHANTFAVDLDSIAVELLWGEQTSRTFTLSNIGDLPVNFYVRIDETYFMGRGIAGSYITCDTGSFTPGETTTWTYTVYNASEDNEWVSDVWLDYPLGVTVLYASYVVGGEGGDMIWDGTTGAGQRINWHGLTTSGWGVLHQYDYATWEVRVELSSEFAGDMTIGWEIGGDGFGVEPHNVTGDIYMLYPLRWINLDTSSGTLGANESCVITANFDTSDIEEAEHSCNIVITSDSWDGKTVPVVLSPILNNNDEFVIENGKWKIENYPNPFNPETTISFFTTECTKHTELSIYNVKGQRVRTLVDEILPAGQYTVIWDGCDDKQMAVSSGIYFYRLKSGSEELQGKMLMLK